MNQPNPKVEAIVAEAVKIGFIDKDEASDCMNYIGNVVDTNQISQLLHMFKFSVHYRILEEFEDKENQDLNTQDNLSGVCSFTDVSDIGSVTSLMERESSNTVELIAAKGIKLPDLIGLKDQELSTEDLFEENPIDFEMNKISESRKELQNSNLALREDLRRSNLEIHQLNLKLLRYENQIKDEKPTRLRSKALGNAFRTAQSSITSCCSLKPDTHD